MDHKIVWFGATTVEAAEWLDKIRDTLIGPGATEFKGRFQDDEKTRFGGGHGSWRVGGAAHAQGFDPIQTRQAGQDLLAGDFAGIKAVITANGDVKTLEGPAKAIQRWALVFPTLFPAGSDKGDTKAAPAIWTRPGGLPEGRRWRFRPRARRSRPPPKPATRPRWPPRSRKSARRAAPATRIIA